MPFDRLSVVPNLVEVRSVVSGGSAIRGLWRAHRLIDDDLKFVAVVHGRDTLATDGIDAPIDLAAGDVPVLNGCSWLTLAGGDGPEELVMVKPPSAGSAIRDADVDADDVDILIGGRLDLNSTGR